MPRCAQLQNRHTEYHTRPERQAASGTGARGRCSACLPFVCRFRAPQTPNRFRQLHHTRYTVTVVLARIAKTIANRPVDTVEETDPAGTVVRSTGTGNGQYRWVLHCAPQILHELLTCRHVHTACHVGSGTRSRNALSRHRSRAISWRKMCQCSASQPCASLATTG